MEIEIIQNPSSEVLNFFDKRIEEFNLARWEVKEKKPVAIQVKDDRGSIVAGATAKTFGYWLLIDTLWVHESLRGKDMGSKILESLESEAKARGCQFSLLDTLGFQAKPFYEKNGYRVQWTQGSYPKEGYKYFMVKNLT